MNKFLFGANGRLFLIGGRPINVGDPSIPTNSTTALTLTDFYVGNSLAHPVFQRKAGTESSARGGYADIPVLFTFAGGAPSGVQARVVSMDNASVVIKDWTDLASLQFVDANKTGFGYLVDVEIGANYQLQIRHKAFPSMASSGARRWGVGVCILLAGQSNMIGTLLGNSFDQIIPGTSINETDAWKSTTYPNVYFGVDGFGVPWTASPNGAPGGGSGTIVPGDSGFDSGAGGGGAFLRMVSANLSAKYGRTIPVCGALWFFKQTGLTAMFPPGDSANLYKSQIYTNSGTAAGSIGWASPPGYGPVDFELAMLHQGEAESGFMSRPDRLAEDKSFYSYLLSVVAPHGRTAANLAFRHAIMGVYTQCALMENIRGAAYDLEAYAAANGWPGVKAGWNCIDLDTADPKDTNNDPGLHFHNISGGNQYAAWGLRRMIQDACKALGCASFGGGGPKISSVTRSGLVATVTIAHDGGTALVARNAANPPTGWYANTAADFSGTDIAVTATVASASTVSITFPSGTVFPVYLKHMGGKVGTMQSQHPDVSNPIYDNVVYPTNVNAGDQYTGLPLQPTPDALMVT